MVLAILVFFVDKCLLKHKYTIMDYCVNKDEKQQF